MKKSPELTAVPVGVVTEMRPDPVAVGTLVDMAVGVAEVTTAYPGVLNLTLSLVGVGSKFVPVMLTGVPLTAIVGVNPVMVGIPLTPVTVKGLLLLADPAGAVTAIVPVVAPAGTVTTSCVAVAALTVAAVPLNVTVFWPAVGLKPVPEIVTILPTAPLPGLKPVMETSAEL